MDPAAGPSCAHRVPGVLIPSVAAASISCKVRRVLVASHMPPAQAHQPSHGIAPPQASRVLAKDDLDRWSLAGCRTTHRFVGYEVAEFVMWREHSTAGCRAAVPWGLRLLVRHLAARNQPEPDVADGLTTRVVRHDPPTLSISLLGSVRPWRCRALEKVGPGSTWTQNVSPTSSRQQAMCLKDRDPVDREVRSKAHGRSRASA